MLIVAFGIPRSASSYTYQITRELLRQHAAKTGKRFVDPLGGEPELLYVTTGEELGKIARSEEARAKGAICLVKTHTSFDDADENLFRDVPVILNTRIPALAAISLIETYREDVAASGQSRFDSGASWTTACSAIEEAFRHEQRWRRMPLHEEVRYWDVTTNALSVAERIAKRLALDVDPAAAVAKFSLGLEPISEHRQEKAVRLEEGEIALVREYFALRRRLAA